MVKRPREECEQSRGGGEEGNEYHGVAAPLPGVPLAEANSPSSTIVQQQAAQIQQLITLNQQQAQAMERQNVSHTELLQQQNANHAAQIDRLLSSLNAVVSSPAVSHPVPSVDAVMEEYRKANEVIDAATGFTALHEFARNGHIAGIKALLAAGANPDKTDRDGNTPLHIAAMGRQGEAVRLLIGGGASVEGRNNNDQTPLLAAVVGAHDGGSITAVEALIEAGARVNVCCSLHLSPALHIAVDNRNIGCVRALLAAHADVHATDYGAADTALGRACGRARTWFKAPMIDVLLEAGSDIEFRDHAGDTLLSLGQHSLLSYLISKGANINAKRYDGKTALLESVLHHKLESVRILLKAGADVSIADNNGLTPAKAAMDKEDSAEMLQLLLSGGAVTVKREEEVE